MMQNLQEQFRQTLTETNALEEKQSNAGGAVNIFRRLSSELRRTAHARNHAPNVMTTLRSGLERKRQRNRRYSLSFDLMCRRRINALTYQPAQLGAPTAGHGQRARFPKDIEDLIREYLMPSKKTMRAQWSIIDVDIEYIGEIKILGTEMESVAELVEFVELGLQMPILRR